MQTKDIINYLNNEQKLFNEAMDNVNKGNELEIGNAKFHSQNILVVHSWFLQNGYTEV